MSNMHRLVSLAEAMAIVEQQEAQELQAWQVILQDTIKDVGKPVEVTAEQLMRLEAWGMLFDFDTGKVILWEFEPESVPETATLEQGQRQ